MNHLTPDQAAAYSQRRLRGEELLTVSDHVAECAHCRANLSKPQDPAKLIRALQTSAHLNYEDLERLVDNSVKPGTRAEFEAHLDTCAICAADFQDLEEGRKSQRRENPGRRLAIPLGVAVAAVFIFVFLQQETSQRPAPEFAPVAALQDSGEAIALDRKGNLRGLSGATPEQRQMVAMVLESGSFAESESLASLRPDPDSLLSGGSTRAAILRASSPVGTAVLSQTPRFQWNSIPTFGEYRISVYGTEAEALALSGPLQTTGWTIPKALARGRTYSWTVTAINGAQQIKAPQAPDPDARFRVASEAEAQEFQSVSHLLRRSELLVAITANRLGLVNEAHDAMAVLAEQNPSSALVDRLRASLPLSLGKR